MSDGFSHQSECCQNLYYHYDYHDLGSKACLSSGMIVLRLMQVLYSGVLDQVGESVWSMIWLWWKTAVTKTSCCCVLTEGHATTSTGYGLGCIAWS